MAITNGYCTLADFKLWLNISSTETDDDSVIEDIIEGVSRFIDGETGRTFYARTETRYFDVPPSLGRTLVLDDDLLTITTLTNGDENTIASTEYNLWPKNDPPYRRIILKASSTEYWEMDSSGNVEDVISVAGTWGYAASAPHDIRQACMMISTAWYKRRFGENTSSTVQITGAGVVIMPQDIPPTAMTILRKYIRRF